MGHHRGALATAESQLRRMLPDGGAHERRCPRRSPARYLVEVLGGDDDLRAQDRPLVLEDTGELLSADAADHAGQGLRRLLNLADGILGDDTHTFTLVRTNEPLRSLHDAVARPGRCGHRAEFVPFPAEEAAAWLGDRHDDDVAGALTLAELFALRRSAEVASRRSAVGLG